MNALETYHLNMCFVTIDPSEIDRIRESGDDHAIAALVSRISERHAEPRARNSRLQTATESADQVRRGGVTETRLLVVRVAFPDCPLSRRDDEEIRHLLTALTRYYVEVSAGNVRLTWELMQPILLPTLMSDYANSEGGRASVGSNAQTMVRDALKGISTQISDFAAFDTDGDHKIDAFLVVHAGGAGESDISDPSLIWSHRGSGAGARTSDGFSVDEFLTVSEESPLGVWCHELGHLLFDWPDILQGVADDGMSITHRWCLMGGGGWNRRGVEDAQGTCPGHPCAPLKARQGWLTIEPTGMNGIFRIKGIAETQTAMKVTTVDAAGSHSMVLENRQQTMFDSGLPGNGLLVWETVENSDRPIRLVPAGGPLHPKLRGTADDPFPGARNIRRFESKGVLIDISASGPTMEVQIAGFSASKRRRAT